jgi:DNA-binding MarR family transcriptional regulator
MNRKNITIPLALVINPELSTAAKVIYAILKTFQTDKNATNLDSSVIVTHGEIIERSNLSKHTVTKALNLLASNGWIEWRQNAGAANQYTFTTPND